MNSGGRERSLDLGVLFGVTQSSTFQGEAERRTEERNVRPNHLPRWDGMGCVSRRGLAGERGGGAEIDGECGMTKGGWKSWYSLGFSIILG